MFTTFGPLVRQYAVVILSNLSIFAFGMGVMWPSPMLVKLTDEEHPVLSRPVTEEEASWIVSLASFISLFNFVIAQLLDRVGRKFCLIFICLPKIVAVCIYLSANEVWLLLLGRAFEGVSEAFAINTVPTYVAEISSKDIRGSLGTIFHLSSSLGVVTMLSVGPFVSYITINIIYLCVTIVAFLPTFILPESPVYLFSKERKEDSIKVLTFLRGSTQNATEELKEYASAQSDTTNKLQLFKDKIFIKTLIIVIVLGFGVQAIGYHANVLYLQVILRETHMTIMPEIVSVIVGCIQLLASFVTPFTTDRFGRKPILNISLLGTCLGMVGLGVFFKLLENGHPIEGFLNTLPLLCYVVTTFCVSGGIASLYWMIISELFEGPGRAIGVSVSLFVTSVSTSLISKYFLMLNNALGPPVIYWIFSTNCLLLCIFINVFLPETKQKTFSEIQTALGAKSKKIDVRF